MAEDDLRLRSVNEGRLLAGPETLQINLGNRCNLSCIFCWNHSPLAPSPTRDWHGQRLSADHVANILGSLPRLRPGRVQLSGRGEPLLHPEAGRLLAALRDIRVPVSIQTNGTAGTLSPEALVELEVDHLLVNISAATAAGYESTHPGRGRLLDEVVGRLERIAELRGTGTRPAVTLVAVIQKSNQHEILPLVELASRLGAARVELKGMELSEGLDSLMLDEGSRRAALAELEEARGRAEALGVAFRASHLEQILRRQTRQGAFSRSLGRGPCFMGWYYLRVTVDGQVMFCCKDKVMGHLDRRSLYETWRAPAYQLQRLAGRDGDLSTGLFDAKCRTCSNFSRNREVRRALQAETPGPPVALPPCRK